MCAQKLVERCEVLHDVAASLLLRANLVRTHTLHLLSQGTYARMKTKLEKAFPDVPEYVWHLTRFMIRFSHDNHGWIYFAPSCSKVSGFDLMVSNAQEVFDQTLPFYELFCDITEYVQHAHMIINSIPALTLEFKLGHAHASMCHLMRLIADYMRLHILVEKIDDRKAMLALHVFSFQVTKNHAEPNVGIVAETSLRFEKPMQTVPEELRGVSEAVGNIIIELREPMLASFDCDKLRQRNALSPLDENANIALPTYAPLSPRSASIPLHEELAMADKYAEWTIYGLLCCPTELIRPEVLQLFQTITRGLLVIPLFGDLVYDIHLATDTLAKHFPPKGVNVAVPRGFKIKNEMRDLAKKATEKCGEIRRERRSFLLGEMATLKGLFEDIPGLVAPKFSMVIAALTMSQAECLMYFAHLNIKATDIPKTRLKLYKPDDYVDPQISQLIGVHMELTELVRRSTPMIQTYFKEYVQTAHRLALAGLTEDVKGLARAGVQQIIESLQTQLDPGKLSDLKAFRMDWARAQASLLSPEYLGVLKKPAIIKLMHRMRLVVAHSLYADSIDELLAERASLAPLFYFRGSLLTIYGQCLHSTDERPRHVLAFIRILASVADGVHSCSPDEVRDQP